MSVVRCDGCERRIDTDFDTEVMSQGSRTLCLHCQNRAGVERDKTGQTGTAPEKCLKTRCFSPLACEGWGYCRERNNEARAEVERERAVRAGVRRAQL